MKLEHGTWVVIADGQKQLVLHNHGDTLMDLRIVSYEEAAVPQTQDLGTDRPGRFAKPEGRRTSADAPDWHELAEDEAARELARRINAWAAEKAFPSLVLVADPDTLGEIRKGLSKQAVCRIVGEIDKDLTKLTITEIERTLAEA